MSSSRTPSTARRTTSNSGINHPNVLSSDPGRDSGSPSLKQEDDSTTAGYQHPAYDRDVQTGEHSTANSVVGDDKDGDDAPVKRKIACMACRNIKLRCLFANSDSAPLDPCKRCSRLSLDCIYKPKRRPVKPGQERQEQPVLGKNGKVSVEGVKLVENVGTGGAGVAPVLATPVVKKPRKRGGGVTGDSQGQVKVKVQQVQQSLPRPGDGAYESEDGSDGSGSGSEDGEVTLDRTSTRPSRPALHPPTFSWSDFDTASTSRQRLQQPLPPGSSHPSGMTGLGEIDPVLTNFAMSPIDPTSIVPSLGGPPTSASSGYGPSGFGLGLGANAFLPPHSVGSTGLATASSLDLADRVVLGDHHARQSLPRTHQNRSIPLDPLDPGSYIGASIGTEGRIASKLPLTNASSASSAHVRLPGTGDVSVPHGSTPSSRAYSQHESTTFSPNLLPPGLNGNGNVGGNKRRQSSTTCRNRGSPPPGGKQLYPMALTTMLEVMSKDANGPMMIGGTPISAERDRRDGRLIERDYGSREQDRRPSEDDRYDDSPHSHGYASLHRDSHSAYTTAVDKDGRPTGRRATLGAEDDDPRLYDEPVRPRKRMRWDDQVQMDANRKRHETQAAYERARGSLASGTEEALGPAHNGYTGRPRGSSEILPDLNGMPDEQPLEGMEDPVTLGLVAPVDVPFLFEQYHSRLNTYLALLDPVLHTPEYCLRTSPILFTAVLAVAAQVYLPEIYKPLRKRATDMLGIAFARGDAHIGMCQALSMLSVWKEANDKATWLRVGYAIRVALELGLDTPRKTPLPEDEFQAREILNGERTFRQLTAFDRTMFLLHGRGHRMVLPGAIHSTREWCEDHPEIYCYADVMLACSSMHGDLSELLNTIKLNPDPMATPSQGMSFKYILYNANREHQTWRDLWFGPNPPGELHPISRAICVFYGINFEFEYEEFSRRFLPYHENIRALGRTISLAVQMLRYIITDLSPNEVILFAPDIITFRAAQAGVFLARHMHRMDPSTLEQVQMVFRDMARECKSFARGQNTAFYQAKFFASLLRISSVAPTRVASRENSPIPGRTEITADDLTARLHQAGNQVPDFSADLDLVGFDDSLTIDALLQESHDWFSVDLLSHMNDPYWNPPPVITGYDVPQAVTA